MNNKVSQLTAVYLGDDFGKYKKVDKNGIVMDMFRFRLPAGTNKPEDLERYKSILEGRGINVHTDDESGTNTGDLLYFDPVFQGNKFKIKITANDKIVVSDDDLDKMTSLLRKTNDPLIKQAGAQIIAQRIFGSFGASAPAAGAAQGQAVGQEETDLEDQE